MNVMSSRRWITRLAKSLAVLLLLIVLIIASSAVFAVIRRNQTLVLPAPTGPYTVGRVEYDWVDQTRADPLAPRAGVRRELVVWAWYPAMRVSGARTAPYLPAKWAQLSDQQHGSFGQLLFQSSDSIQAHSVENAQLATAYTRYPVLIFEPGLGNIPAQYTTLLEDLASHGYIIFAIAPTYSSDVVAFPDGHVAEATAAGNPGDASDTQAAGDRLISVWAQDVVFVMNQLDRLNAAPGTMWSQRLDLTRLGVFGHSFGGATAAQVCQMDTRCKAGIDLDGDLFGPVVQTGLEKPFMVIQSGQCSTPSASGCSSFATEVQAILRTVPANERYNLRIKGTQHFNFSDYALYFSPARALGALGSIDGARGLQITRAYVRAFFDTYLKESPSPLLQGPARAYPEMQFLAVLQNLPKYGQAMLSVWFLLHGRRFHARPRPCASASDSTGVLTVRGTPGQLLEIDGRVQIPVQHQLTLLTVEGAGLEGEIFFDPATGTAPLAGRLPAIRQDHPRPIPDGFVKQLPLELIEAHIPDGLRQMVILEHAADMQVFDDQHGLGFRQPGRDLM
jgi:predicted dienelactone hydrolase